MKEVKFRKRKFSIIEKQEVLFKYKSDFCNGVVLFLNIGTQIKNQIKKFKILFKSVLI